MVSNGRFLKGLLVLLILLNSVSTVAVAQNQPRQVLFDGDPSELATVHTNGQTYVVYEYDNLLPYASGIEVYTDGERVTAAETVDEVFRALARRRATKFEPEARSIERLRQVIERSQSIQTATTDAITALNETLAYRETLKETTVDNTTAWEAAIETSESLDGTFAKGFTGGAADAGQLRNQLLAIRASAASLESNASRVLSLLQRQQAGEEIDRSDLYRRYAALYAELERLRSQVANSRPALLETANASRAAASEARSLPTVGEEIHRRFAALGDALDRTANGLEESGPALSALRAALPQVATDEAFQRQLTERWKQRKGVLVKIYATLAEGGLLLVALAIASFETRREATMQ